jgi:hypothetical protein
MATYYCQSSSFLKIPAEKLGRAKEILDTLFKDADLEGSFLGFAYEFKGNGVCIFSQDEFNPEDAEIAARRLVDELEIDDPFVCSWSYSCSKPRIDEFGGGAFVVKRGYKTLWLDVQSLAKDAVEQNRLEELDEVALASN